MSNPSHSYRSSFEENISSLLEELALAQKWQRPSLLLAIHKSKFGQDRAEKALEDRLKQSGQNVTYVTVDKEHSDVPHLIADSLVAHEAVFFVSNLDWGGGADRRDAYRALNMYRELFVDNRLKAVFWLTINEAANLARLAPDFWAFRHRVIEFTGQRIPRQVELPAGLLLWDMQNTVDPYESLQARISVREQLLARLPHTNEARSTRIDLFSNLGYLYWLLGDPDQSAAQFIAGLDLASEQYAGKVRASLLNGLAIVAYEAHDYERSVELLQTALQDGPDDPSLLVNLSASCSALGRNQEAVTLAKKAVRAGANDQRVWSAVGYIYAGIGKYDVAIECFGKSAELSPRLAAPHAALAICYDLVERPDEVAHQMRLASQLARDSMRVYLDIYAAALAGNVPRASELASAAIRSNQISAVDIRREPNLSLLLDRQQIQQMSS